MKILRRNLSLMLAVRYLNPLRSLFSVITLICLAGVALGVMVLIVVLSVMEGLQKEMESRVLAASPHFVLEMTDGMKRVSISDDAVDWPQLQESLEKLPEVVTVYPQLESDAFAQTDLGRTTVRFSAIQPHNKGQVEGLLPTLKAGTFDFGEGLDQECVVSAALADGLELQPGDTLHLTPVGSLDEVANIYAMIQNPLQTQENKAFTEAVATVFDGAAATEGGVCVAQEKLDAVTDIILSFPADRLRQSEKDACATLFELAQSHGNGTPFTEEEQKRWQETAAGIAALDRDKEDGKAVKSINEMVMPVDLRVIGIYQMPENMPGPQVYVPLQIAQDIMGYSVDGIGQIMGLCLRVRDAHNPGDTAEQIGRLLRPVPADDGHYPNGAYWYLTSWQNKFKQWYELIANERVMMGFVLSIISLIASFCIMAVMFTVSLQRRREIAVLQAMGATPSKIIGIFAWQGVIIGFVGALSGIGLALLVLHYRLEIQSALAGMGLDPFPMQAHGITLPAAYEPATFAWQAFKAFIMVTLASVVPAFVVARQDPARALRSN